MSKVDIFLFIFLLIACAPFIAHASENCPANVDPVYCKIAQETGGKVIEDGSPQDLKEVSKTSPKLDEPKVKHAYSPYSKNIGCEQWTEKREQQICNSLSDNLEWGWTGHATIAPSWRVSWTTVKNVYCDLTMSKTDLPILEKMCGNDIKPYMSCLKLMDWRFATGVEYLIKTIRAQSEVSQEFKGTVYDPHNDNYLLKGGCKE